VQRGRREGEREGNRDEMTGNRAGRGMGWDGMGWDGMRRRRDAERGGTRRKGNSAFPLRLVASTHVTHGDKKDGINRRYTGYKKDAI
jgi:hypothetical protein